MSNITLLGIDLAKNIFQVCAMNQANKVQFNHKLTRNKLAEFISQQETTTIAMEACGSSNYWARVFTDMGHKVKLVPAQHVKPFVKGNKNDRNDAVAICEAYNRPNMYYATIKTKEQQDLHMLHKMRKLYTKHKSSYANQLRAYLSEYGIILNRQVATLYKKVPFILENAENDLTDMARELLHIQFNELKHMDEKLKILIQKIKVLSTNNEHIKRLLEIPGYGPILSSLLYSSAGNGKQFKKGRHMSAWLGLTPAHFGTGGKNTNVGISKKGDNYIRSQLIHGARTVVTWASKKDDKLSLWINNLVARRGKKIAYVALANKMARAAWNVLQGKKYQPELICGL